MTVTSAQVAAKWNEKIWTNAAITAITTQIFKFETTEESQKEVEDLYEDTILNYFEYSVERNERVTEIGGAQNPYFIFKVSVRYTKQKDTTGDSYTDVRDAIETLCDTVRSQLGSDWGGVVENITTDPIAPSDTTSAAVNNTDVWQQTVNFTAFYQS